MSVYKLKLWTLDDYDKGVYTDIYLNVTNIIGFYIPSLTEDDPYQAINIFIPGEIITVLKQDHIVDYLYDNFAMGAIKN